MGAVGTTLGGKYLLRQELGRGGMGAVFAATNTWTGRLVAIKTLRAEYAQSQSVLDRFWQEARAASKLRHPHIVDVLDMGWDEPTGEPFLVQEFLEGASLDVVLKQTPGGRLACAQAIAALLPIMGALTACHRVGIIHRDIKPANIFVVATEDGRALPKLIDFGVSKSLGPDDSSPAQTVVGTPIGSPAYMSPEQAMGEGYVDARADVWSMGATLFELLTGRRPFTGPNAHVVLAKVIQDAPPRVLDVAPDVPASVAAAVDRAMERDLSQRFASMADFAIALLRCEVCRDGAVRSAPGVERALSDIFAESSSEVRAEALAREPPPSVLPVRDPSNAAPLGAPPRAMRSFTLAVTVPLALAATVLGLWWRWTSLRSTSAPVTSSHAEQPAPPQAPPPAPPAIAAPTVTPPTATPRADASAPLRQRVLSHRSPTAPPAEPRRAPRRAQDSLAPDDSPYDPTPAR